MLVTTTNHVEGKKITNYHGVVTGQTILGANIFKDLLSGLRDLVGGRSGAYEKELKKARDIALQDLQQTAHALGANAVVGVQFSYEVLGQSNGMLMVSINGTAVTLE